MAGIGVRLNRIFEKNTITTNLIGFSYSTVVTIAPMMVVILNLILMEELNFPVSDMPRVSCFPVRFSISLFLRY